MHKLILKFSAFLLASLYYSHLIAAEIEVGAGYYGTISNGNVFEFGETVDFANGTSGAIAVVSDGLSGETFQPGGSCPGQGNVFCLM